MADNIQLNVGAGGDLLAADDIAGAKYQRGKLIIGDNGTNDGDVSASNPLPVTLPADQYIGANVTSAGNSSTGALAGAAVFTGAWEDVSRFDSLVVAVATDQDGSYAIQFSPDGVNIDSSLTRYYSTDQIEPPHRFTITRAYFRIVYTNGTDAQTYFRLQIHYGTYQNLNSPLDSTLSQDFDALAVRPSDPHDEVALGLRQGVMLWNKFGYNQDVDTGTEVVASWGGTFNPLTTATTLNIVSTSGNDITSSGTGVRSIVVYGVDNQRNEVIEVVQMNGITPVVTTSQWLGINRVAMFLCGSGQVNEGTINVTATTGGSQMAQMPAGIGVTQQCIFHIPVGSQFLVKWIRVNTLKQAAQNPKVQVSLWVYSTVNNGKQRIYTTLIDTSVSSLASEQLALPLPIGESSVMWLEATTDKNDTIVNARFSGELVRAAATQ
jgi:hypothetical protein